MTELPPAFRYWAFISYSHSDRRVAERMHRWLETYRIPKHLVGNEEDRAVPNRLHPVFRDREELASSADLGDRLTEALRASRSLVVVCSPRSAKSRWVNEEIRQFKAMGRADRVFCVVVDGEPNAADPEQECLPAAVRFHVAEDGTLTDRPAEPIAADARPHGDGIDLARLKLLAGLTGLRFDALRRRDHARRIQRLKWVTTGALVIVSSLSLLSVLLYDAKEDATTAWGLERVAKEAAQSAEKSEAAARADAEDARDDAEEARDDAEKARDEAVVARRYAEEQEAEALRHLRSALTATGRNHVEEAMERFAEGNLLRAAVAAASALAPSDARGMLYLPEGSPERRRATTLSRRVGPVLLTSGHAAAGQRCGEFVTSFAEGPGLLLVGTMKRWLLYDVQSGALRGTGELEDDVIVFATWDPERRGFLCVDAAGDAGVIRVDPPAFENLPDLGRFVPRAGDGIVVGRERIVHVRSGDGRLTVVGEEGTTDLGARILAHHETEEGIALILADGRWLVFSDQVREVRRLGAKAAAAWFAPGGTRALVADETGRVLWWSEDETPLLTLPSSMTARHVGAWPDGLPWIIDDRGSILAIVDGAVRWAGLSDRAAISPPIALREAPLLFAPSAAVDGRGAGWAVVEGREGRTRAFQPTVAQVGANARQWRTTTTSPDGSLIVQIDDDKRVAIVRPRNVPSWATTKLPAGSGKTIDVATVRTGKGFRHRVVRHAEGGRLDVLDLAEKHSWRTVDYKTDLKPHGEALVLIRSMALSPDGSECHLLMEPSGLLTVDLETGAVRETLTRGGGLTPTEEHPFTLPFKTLSALEDGRVLVAAPLGGFCAVDTVKGEIAQYLIAPGPSYVSRMAQVGDLVAIGGAENARTTITLIDLPSGEALARLEGHHGQIRRLWFAGATRLHAEGPDDHTVWDLGSAVPWRVPPGPDRYHLSSPTVAGGRVVQLVGERGAGGGTAGEPALMGDFVTSFDPLAQRIESRNPVSWVGLTDLRTDRRGRLHTFTGGAWWRWRRGEPPRKVRELPESAATAVVATDGATALVRLTDDRLVELSDGNDPFELIAEKCDRFHASPDLATLVFEDAEKAWHVREDGVTRPASADLPRWSWSPVVTDDGRVAYVFGRELVLYDLSTEQELMRIDTGLDVRGVRSGPSAAEFLVWNNAGWVRVFADDGVELHQETLPASFGRAFGFALELVDDGGWLRVMPQLQDVAAGRCLRWNAAPIEQSQRAGMLRVLGADAIPFEECTLFGVQAPPRDPDQSGER